MDAQQFEAILTQLERQTGLLVLIKRQVDDLLTGRQAEARTPEGWPICARHGLPLRPREKQGDTWYSHKVVHPETGEELFCKGRPGNDSPGWDVPGPDEPPAPPAPPPAPPAPAAPTIDPLDIQRPAQAGKPSAQPGRDLGQKSPAAGPGQRPKTQASQAQQRQAVAAPVKAPIAAPVKGDHRQQFYAEAGEAFTAGRIDHHRFNALVGRANNEGWTAALDELRLCLEHA